MAHEPDHEQGLTVVREALPRFDVLQLGFQQRQVFDVGVALEHSLGELKEWDMFTGRLLVKRTVVAMRRAF